jgi:transposase
LPGQHITDQGSAKEAIQVPLDLDGLRIVRQETSADGTLRVEVIASSEWANCPRCQSRCSKIHDQRARSKRDIALRGYPVELLLWKRRFRCFVCKKPLTETDNVCGWRRRTTCRLREALGKQACQQSVAQVARTYGGAESFVQRCFEQEASKQLEKHGYKLEETQELETPASLGIDEFARRKGHRYDTLLADVGGKRLLAIGSGRKLEDVQKLLERLKDPDAVQAVSMDMSASYRPAVQLCLPNAQIVVDHFHVIQHVMKGFRKTVQRWAKKTEGKALLEGKQFLFLKALEDLTSEQQQERKEIAEKLPQLERAWQLKEALRSWYAKATVETAEAELDSWIAQVQQEGPDTLRKTLSAFKNWKAEILAFFRFRIFNGFVEGKNNRTKTLMRQGYGFANRQHLRLRILLGDLP